MIDRLKQLTDFIAGFTSDDILKGKIVEADKQFFLVDDGLFRLAQNVKENSGMEPFSEGIFLGDVKKKEFRPSLALLDMIAEHSDRKLFTDSEGETHFLYGKDLFGKSIKRGDILKGLVLVQNERDENLGYGKVVNAHRDNNANKVVVKNILDRGDFIRRDK